MGGVAQGAATVVTAVGTAAVGAATALGGIALQSSEAASRVNDMAQVLGLSNRAFQEWDYILGLNGASIDSFGVGMKTLQTTMDDAANGSKSAIEKFSRVGLSLKDIKDLSPEEAMEAVIRQLQAMPEGAEKTALALDMFGKQGMALMPVLNMTADEVEGLKNTAHDLNMIMSDEAIKAGDDFGDMLDTAKGMVKGLGNAMGATLLPSMTKGLEAFIGFVSGAKGADKALEEAFDGVISAITAQIPQFVEIGATVILSIIGGLTGALPNLVSGVLQVLPLVVMTLMQMMPDILNAGIEVVLAIIQGITQSLPELIPVAIEAILLIVQALIDNAPLLLAAAIQLIQALVLGLIGALPQLVKEMPQLVQGVVDGLIAALPLLLDAAIAIILALVDFMLSDTDEFIDMTIKIVLAIGQGLIKAVGLLAAAALKLIVKLIEYIYSHNDEIQESGRNLLRALIDGLVGAITLAVSAAGEVAQSIVNTFTRVDWGEIGRSIIDGLTNALFGGVGRVWDAAQNLAESAWNAFTDFLDINSPSGLFEWGGDMSVDGYTGAIMDGADKARRSAEALASAGFDGLTQQQSRYFSAVETSPIRTPSDFRIEIGEISISSPNIKTPGETDRIGREIATKTAKEMRLAGVFPTQG